MSIPSLPPVLDGRDALTADWASEVDATARQLAAEWQLTDAAPDEPGSDGSDGSDGSGGRGGPDERGGWGTQGEPGRGTAEAAGELVGGGSWVRPVRSGQGAATLVLDLPADPAVAHVALAFQHWAGDAAPRLLWADPHRRAVLLAGHPGRPLLEEWDLQACERIAALYPALHRTPPPQLPRLSELIGQWADELRPDDVPVPRRLVEQAVHLARGFASDADTDVALLHGDLHFGTAEESGDALSVVRPRPVAGDPHAEPAPLLWHRWSELDGYLREGLRRRLFTMIDAAGLDEQRAKAWVVVRAVVGAHQQARRAAGPPGEGRLGDGPRELVTRFIAVAKAVQD